MRIFKTCIQSLCAYAACTAASVPSIAQDETPCSFTADGKSYTGKVSTQSFPATGEFSVLCEDSGDTAKFVQFVFKDEKSAREGTTLKIVKNFITKAEQANEVSLSFDNSFESYDESPGKITIFKESGRPTVEAVDVSLRDISKKQVAVSAKVSF